MRYYSTQRPILPGGFPKPVGNRALDVRNFEDKTYCEEIEREAWGYIEYEHPIHPESALDYELTPPPRKIRIVRFAGVDSWGREVFKDETGKLWKYTEPGEAPKERHERLYSSTGNALDGEPCWPMLPDIDYRILADKEGTK